MKNHVLYSRIAKTQTGELAQEVASHLEDSYWIYYGPGGILKNYYTISPAYNCGCWNCHVRSYATYRKIYDAFHRPHYGGARSSARFIGD